MIVLSLWLPAVVPKRLCGAVLLTARWRDTPTVFGRKATVKPLLAGFAGPANADAGLANATAEEGG
jgi:hypothetical protein